jgi:chromosome partitioning protein
LRTTVAISNQKGGVGKTTTAINLGASLAFKGKKTLIVDVDPQGNATTGLGVERSSLETGLYKLLTGGAAGEEAVLSTDLPLLFLIPSTKDLIGAEIELVGEEGRESRLREVLSPLQSSFDFILLDCPPSLGLLTLNALTAADSLLIPLQCEYYALEGLSSLLETLKLVQRSFNPRLKLGGILLTMFDGRNRLSRQVAEEVRRYFPGSLFKTVIHRNVRLSECPSHGKPALLYDPHSTGAENYRRLAEEILARAEEYRLASGSPPTVKAAGEPNDS